MTQIKHRDSNIELFRIVLMLLIVAHHYVVNSGVIDDIICSPIGFKSLFMLVFGAWGKVGINCFVLITGYYLCKSNISVKKFLKLMLEYLFYKYVIYFGFLLTGIVKFGWGRLLRVLLPITSITSDFVPCFLLFYLLVPFCNILIQELDQHKHLLLLVILFLFILF